MDGDETTTYAMPPHMVEAVGGDVWAVIHIAIGPDGTASQVYVLSEMSDDLSSAVQAAAAAAANAVRASIESALAE